MGGRKLTSKRSYDEQSNVTYTELSLLTKFRHNCVCSCYTRQNDSGDMGSMFEHDIPLQLQMFYDRWQ